MEQLYIAFAMARPYLLSSSLQIPYFISFVSPLFCIQFQSSILFVHHIFSHPLSAHQTENLFSFYSSSSSTIFFFRFWLLYVVRRTIYTHPASILCLVYHLFIYTDRSIFMRVRLLVWESTRNEKCPLMGHHLVHMPLWTIWNCCLNQTINKISPDRTNRRKLVEKLEWLDSFVSTAERRHRKRLVNDLNCDKMISSDFHGHHKVWMILVPMPSVWLISRDHSTDSFFPFCSRISTQRIFHFAKHINRIDLFSHTATASVATLPSGSHGGV